MATPILPTMRAALLVGLGGGLGSMTRYLVTRAMASGAGVPWATFTVNIVGSLILGIVTGLLVNDDNETVRLALMVGFLGGFTTFSTLAVETVALVRDGAMSHAFVNVALSLVAGLVAAIVGLLIGEAIRAG